VGDKGEEDKEEKRYSPLENLDRTDHGAPCQSVSPLHISPQSSSYLLPNVPICSLSFLPIFPLFLRPYSLIAEA
jgi:hypothetical protein